MKKQSKSKVGAVVQYCGHDATFIADVYHIGNAVAVLAAAPNIEQHLKRPSKNPTHHMQDFPGPVLWSPGRGVFTVPEKNVQLCTGKNCKICDGFK